MLVSAVLDFTTIEFHVRNDVPYILFLPTYAATAWYHGKLEGRKPLKTLLKEVEKFALGEYSEALLKGDRLTKRERTRMIEKMAHLTGLSAEFIDRTNLRIRTSISSRSFCATEDRPLAGSTAASWAATVWASQTNLNMTR